MTEASRVQKLLTKQNDEIDILKNRIEKLEAALREIASVSKVIARNEDMAQALVVVLTSHRKIALTVLGEKKDD